MPSTTRTSGGRTAAELNAWASDRLRSAGVVAPEHDAEVLWRAASADRDSEAMFTAMVERRARREPLAYVLGRCRFRDIDLVVDGRVHVPRDDRTGLLVDVGGEAPHGARVHEVGTGAGAVALALKHERADLVVSASDLSAAAVDVARLNAERLELDVPVLLANGLPPGEYDLVLANLPYSSVDELEDTLPPESSRYQPHVAIVAGASGLDAIEPFVAALPSGQRVALEHAPQQAAAVRDLLREPTTRRDRAGEERATVGHAP